MTEDLKNRRKHTRVKFEIDFELILSDMKIAGMTKNLSFGGAYLICESGVNPGEGQKGTLRLILNPMPQELAISFTGRIVHVEEGGLGLKFLSIDLEGYQEFKNLMIYNSSDPDKLRQELEKDPGLIIKKL
ncbi:PilZ domain-containing protein [bacterium]|nr:PilZ domain-containing protein [bacterium]